MLLAKSGCVTGKAFALQIRRGGLELGPVVVGGQVWKTLM